MINSRRASVVVLDLDNTLFDWVEIWFQSFNAMLQRLAADSGVPQAELEADFRKVHQRHGTSEYAFAIEELESLRIRFPSEDLATKFDEAIHAYSRARKVALALYPGVRETLEALQQIGCLLVGYTESMAFYTNYRVRNLNLDLFLDYLYSPEDHQLPQNLSADQVRKYPPERYKYRHTVQRFTPSGEVKPNAGVLLSILRDCQATCDETIYVGDSPMKDIRMAHEAGVRAVLALYGRAQDRPEYELLRRVTHWTDADVEREKALLAGSDAAPKCVLSSGFGELTCPQLPAQ